MPENTAPTPTPNPLDSPSGFNSHKVLAAVGIILVVTILVGAAWYFYQTNYNSADYENEKVVKTTTTSANSKTATSSTNSAY